jgi:hypothetical protein
MVENHPPRRTVYGRDHAAARTPDDRERRAQARQAAEALFAQKPTITPITAPPVHPTPRAQTELIDTAASRDPRLREIPIAHVSRIRTWMREVALGIWAAG